MSLTAGGHGADDTVGMAYYFTCALSPNHQWRRPTGAAVPRQTAAAAPKIHG